MRPVSVVAALFAVASATLGLAATKDWAFQVRERPGVPKLSEEARDWSSHPIDAFIWKQLDRAGLRPSATNAHEASCAQREARRGAEVPLALRPRRAGSASHTKRVIVRNDVHLLPSPYLRRHQNFARQIQSTSCASSQAASRSRTAIWLKTPFPVLLPLDNHIRLRSPQRGSRNRRS